MNRTVLKTSKDVKAWFNNDITILSFDTEGTSLRMSEFELEGMSFCDGYRTAYIDLVNNEDKEAILKIVRAHFAAVLSTLIGHNLAFDLKVCVKYSIPFKHLKLYDTMTAQHLINEEESLGLKDLAKKYLGQETVPYEVARAKGPSSFVFYEYAMNDAEWTWELMKVQKQPLIEQGLVPLFRNIEMPFILCIVEMETNGILVDIKKVEKITSDLKNTIADLELKMYKCLSIPYTMQANLMDGSLSISSKVSFTSGLDLQKILYEDLKLPIMETTPSGQPSVGREALDKLKGKHEFVDLLRQYKMAQKLLTAFFEPLPSFVDPDGKVRAHFNNCGTVTGRLSSSKPNMQQLPKVKKELPINTRDCFIAGVGRKIITCDYSGQELRILAHLSKEPSMIESFIKGKDLHLATANDFFSLGIKEEDLYEKAPGYEEAKKKFKTERDKAKTINFGIAYGKGAYGFSKDFGISEQESQKILDRYFAALPKVKASIDECHARVKRFGYVCSETGRRRRFQPKPNTNYYSGGALRESYNFLIQGYASDMVRLAANNCYNLARNNSVWNLNLLASVHDELVFSVKEEYVQEAAAKIKECFETAVKLDVPVVAEIGIGDSYGEAK